MSKKGPSWERECSRKFSLWWTDGQDDSLFWRTSMSGGRASIRSKQGKKTAGHCGDFSATNEEAAPFTKLITPEVKRGYSRFSLMDLLDKPRPQVLQEWEKWILQAQAAQLTAGTFAWVIVAKRDGRKPIVVIPYNLVKELRKFGCFEYGQTPRLSMNLEIGEPTAHFEIVGMVLEDFFRQVRPENIKNLLAALDKRN